MAEFSFLPSIQLTREVEAEWHEMEALIYWLWLDSGVCHRAQIGNLHALQNTGNIWETSGKFPLHSSEFQEVIKMNSAERLRV